MRFWAKWRGRVGELICISFLILTTYEIGRAKFWILEQKFFAPV